MLHLTSGTSPPSPKGDGPLERGLAMCLPVYSSRAPMPGPHLAWHRGRNDTQSINNRFYSGVQEEPGERSEGQKESLRR